MEITENCKIGQENQPLVRATDVSGLIESGVRLVEEAEDSVIAPIGSQPDRFGIWQDVFHYLAVHYRRDIPDTVGEFMD